jgi:hypothetical protein
MLFTVVEKHARDSRAFNPGSMSTISAARDHLADVLRSTVQPAPKSTARLCTAASRWPAVIGNHTFGGAP